MGQRQSAPSRRALTVSTVGTQTAVHLPPKARGEIGLPDLLRELGVEALDKLVERLRWQNSISAARLACRALREAIDGSTVQLTVTAKEADRERLATAQSAPQSLERWPRLRRLCVHVNADVDARSSEAAFLLLLPFARFAHGATQHVTGLCLRATEASLAGAEAAVALLPPYLPQLRVLDMRGLASCFSQDPLKQRLMYRALATLPHLEELGLPSCECLGSIGELAASGGSRLRRLLVSGHEYVNGAVIDAARQLSEDAAAGIGRLSQLQRLELSACAPTKRWDGTCTGGFLALLKHLPPSLEDLVVERVCFITSPSEWPNDGVHALKATCRSGRMQSLRIGYVDSWFPLGIHVQLRSFALLAADLLASGAAQWLQRVSVHTLYWGYEPTAEYDGDWEGDKEPRLTAAHLRALRSFRQQCCASFDVKCLKLHERPATEAYFLQLWGALGTKPQELELWPAVGLEIGVLTLRLCAEPTASQGAAALRGAAVQEGSVAPGAPPAAAGAAPAPHTSQQLPDMGSLLRAAVSQLRRKADARLPYHAYAWHAVLVTGLEEALLADAEALGCWVRDLASRAARDAAEPGAPDVLLLVEEHSAVPAAGAVILALRKPGDAVAVLEAAAQPGEGANSSSGAVVEACTFPIEGEEGASLGVLYESCSDVLSSVWGPRMLAAGRSEEARLLRWLWAAIMGLERLPDVSIRDGAWA